MSTETENRFWAEEAKRADAGSGMTKEQKTGASMVFAWLDSPQGGKFPDIDDPSPLRESLSRDNPESRWHEEQRTPSHRRSWACIPLTDAVNAYEYIRGLAAADESR